METSPAIRLVIVDDQELIRMGLYSVLSRVSTMKIVGEAVDGVSAISMCVDLRPDVVLMDIMMPRKDGIEATKEIKAVLPNTRVLMFTSNEKESDMFAALAAGADGYCLKDIPPDSLLLAVQAVHTGATWLDPQIARHVLSTVNIAPSQKSSVKASGFSLSPRELDVLHLVVEGLSNNEIATRLIISADTVKSHMRNLMDKLAVSDRTQAAVKAMREGLVPIQIPH